MLALPIGFIVICGIVLPRNEARADAGDCDGWQCVPNVQILGPTEGGMGTPCAPRPGNRFVFGVWPPKGNTYSYVCEQTPQGAWVWAMPTLELIGVRQPFEPCIAFGRPVQETYGRSPVAQSPDGYSMWCDDAHRWQPFPQQSARQ
jgi:hypothetical protein